MLAILMSSKNCVRLISRTLSWSVLALIIVLMPLSIQGESLTIERIASLPSFIGTEPVSPVWAPDSSLVAFLWNDKGMPFRDVWIVSTAQITPKQITDLARDFLYSERPISDPNEALAQKAAARARRGVSEVVWTPDGKALIFSYQRDLFRIQADGNDLKRLTRSAKNKYALSFSPNGKFLSYLQEGDLWLWNQETNDLVQATHFAIPSAARGVEGQRGTSQDMEFVSYQWSPDNRHIALYSEDQSKAREVLFPDYLTEETTVNALRRPYPGDNDCLRTISIYSLEEGRLRIVDLEDKTDRRISNYSWSPTGGMLLIDQNSEDAIYRWIYVLKVEDNSLREVWQDSRLTRIWQIGTSEWQSDGRGILFVSDHEGFNHLYALPLNKPAPQALTKGNWEIIDWSGRSTTIAISSKTKEVYFVSTKKNPYERHLYRVPEAGGSIAQVTSLAGCHSPFLSPDGTKIALLHSNDVTPTELYMIEINSSASERQITHSPPKEFYAYKWVEPQYVTFKSHVDGETLHGRLIEPPNLDHSKKYPAILGPVYSDTVRNQWRGLNGTMQQYLALEGQYICLQVDVRRSSGYGNKFRDRLKYDLGGLDIEDLVSGVNYLKTLPYVDAERIGIWGSSYGGLLTILSLFKKPGVYKAGVAGAPATNCWHAQAEEVRNFGRPNTHPEALRQASSICFGEDLQDHLMIIHGVQDVTCQFKDSIALAEKLMMLGKDFDLVIAPSAGHGWAQRDYAAVYLMRKLVSHFDRYLGRGPR